VAKWCDEGETDVLRIAVKEDVSPVGTLYLGIYTNNAEPAEAADLGDITEPAGNGYARKALTAANWTVSGDLASYAQQIFEATGAWGNCYGYFLATSVDASGHLWAVENFSNGPYNIQNNGDQIKVTPKIRAA
jgi:hypothetical protein